MTEKRVALVTGASRGIGRAIALRLAEDGCFVIINYRGAKEKAEEVKTEIESRGGEAAVYACDVADFEACGSMFQEVIKTYGRMDVLVNNAGIVKDGLLMAMKEEDFSKVVDVNLKGTFPLHPSCGPPDDPPAKRPDRQYGFRGGNPGKRRTGELRSLQGRHHRSYQSGGKRAGRPRNHRECRGSGLY